MSTYKTHLFICTNGAKDQPGKCAIKGADDLHAKVKAACQPLGRHVRINRSGCLGHCERGISAVLYPEGQWFLDLTPESADQLIQAAKDHSER